MASIKCLLKEGSLEGYTHMDLGITKHHFEIGAGKDNSCWHKS